MKVVVAGGSGFVGEALVRHLIQQGHDTAVLTRNPAKVNLGRPVAWDGRSQGAWSEEAAAADAIVNLAGENLADGRWTEERKRRLVQSRIEPTRALVEAIRRAPESSSASSQRIFVNASAVGFYGPRGDEVLDESAPAGEGFLASLVSQWESEARAGDPFARLVIFRFGVVIGHGGGAVAKMLLPFKLGLGGRISSGQQWFSWIGREDVVRVIEWALSHDDVRGVYNATSPEPVRNREFTAALARALHRPAIVPIPALAMKILFGQMAEETLLSGQRVVPSRLVKNGFGFERNTIDSALQHALHRR